MYPGYIFICLNINKVNHNEDNQKNLINLLRKEKNKMIRHLTASSFSCSPCLSSSINCNHFLRC